MTSETHEQCTLQAVDFCQETVTSTTTKTQDATAASLPTFVNDDFWESISISLHTYITS